jgi:hypothetical protein
MKGNIRLKFRAHKTTCVYRLTEFRRHILFPSRGRWIVQGRLMRASLGMISLKFVAQPHRGR